MDRITFHISTISITKLIKGKMHNIKCVLVEGQTHLNVVQTETEL